MSSTRSISLGNQALSSSGRTGVRHRQGARRSVLIDRFGRRIDHLRLSVTDACDMRCCYCRPRTDGSPRQPDHLTDKQRIELVAFLQARFGLTQVRLTGGEPLIYEGILELIHDLKHFVPDVALTLTTNARHLGKYAEALRSAGIERINVSLDTINPSRFRAMTGVDIAPVLEGLDAAIRAGFPPPRLNSVVLKGMNDGEIISLARWGIERGCEVRFLEAMPIGPATDTNRAHFVSASEIRGLLTETFDLTPIASVPGATATRYRAKGGGVEGVLGIIAPVTEPFCGSCRRVRVTAAGLFYPCLLQAYHADLRPVWQGGSMCESTAESLVLSAVEHKNEKGTVQPTAMIQLGG